MKNTTLTKLARLAGSALATLVLMGSAFTADAAGFLKLGDIPGESADTDHKEWIIIESMSQGITRGAGLTGQSRRRGSVVLEDLTCTKELDKSSPKLAEAVCTGLVIPVIEIELTRPVPDPSGTAKRVPYLKYEIKGTYIEMDRATGAQKGNVEYSWKVEEGES